MTKSPVLLVPCLSVSGAGIEFGLARKTDVPEVGEDILVNPRIDVVLFLYPEVGLEQIAMSF